MVNFFSIVFYTATCVYCFFTSIEMWKLFYPPRCKGNFCYRSLLPLNSRVDVHAYLYSSPDLPGIPVWNATNVSSAEEIETRFELPIPPAVRLGRQSELWLVFELRRVSATDNEQSTGVVPQMPTEHPIAVARINVVGYYAPRKTSSATMLLERDEPSTRAVATADETAGLAPATGDGKLPHFIYSGRLCELRLVGDATPHGHTHFPDGQPIGSAIDTRLRRYSPHFYVETFNLLRKHANPFSSNISKAHPMLRLKMKPISLGRHRATRQAEQAFSMLGETLMLGEELDEIRELLSDERIFRFVVMQIISLLHVIFDVLAFKNDIGKQRAQPISHIPPSLFPPSHPSPTPLPQASGRAERRCLGYPHARCCPPPRRPSSFICTCSTRITSTSW